MTPGISRLSSGASLEGKEGRQRIRSEELLVRLGMNPSATPSHCGSIPSGSCINGRVRREHPFSQRFLKA